MQRLLAAAPVGDVLSKDVMDGLAMEYRAYANDNPTHAAATVAIKILTSVIERSKASTMMGLEKEIKEAAAALRRRNPYSIPLEAGCELFLRCGALVPLPACPLPCSITPVPL